MKADAAVTWEALETAISVCRRCGLCGARTLAVPGEGSRSARLMVVGEGPGFEEDRQGRPFVGPAGQLLDKMLAAVGIRREDVYICNVVKCRPPGNRVPTDEEAGACMPYLRAQYSLLRPEVILCLGATAAKHLCDPEMRITRDRGKWIEKKGVWMLPTYHPAALLRDASKKRDAWEDMKALRAKLDEIERAESL